VTTSHTRTVRQCHESEVYDARAAELAATVRDEDLVVDSHKPPYPNREHVRFLDYMFAQMGSLAGKRVLEIGCGSGTLSTYLAMRGADVVGIDVSEGMLALGRRRAAANDVSSKVSFRASPIETLDMPDDHFDVVVANQVLHHLELAAAMPNIARMLRPDGVALFAEPVLLLPNFFRRLRYSRLVLRRFPSRADTPDERSVDKDDLALIRRAFTGSEVRTFQLTARLQNFRELSNVVFARLERADDFLLKYLPPTRVLGRYVVLVLRSH
jgi:2-polyprenyl-3-methyl-5-hydroxy-6-metoxy-1,4-benzoquinol methylase